MAVCAQQGIILVAVIIFITVGQLIMSLL